MKGRPVLRFLNTWLQRGRPSKTAFPYQVRVSPKAKHVRLRIKQGVGLEVVLPQGFPVRQAPEILDRNREWIEQHRREITAAADMVRGPHCLPGRIRLEAANRAFFVRYEPLPSQEPCLDRPSPDTVRLRADPDQAADACCALLQAWLKEEARQILVPWALQQARRLEIPLSRVQIRKQQTRWGSMSSKGTLSLNCCLLFLPPRLVHHVIIHELCHRLHSNHGPEFKALLSRLSPQRERYEAELKAVGLESVPLWAKV